MWKQALCQTCSSCSADKEGTPKGSRGSGGVELEEYVDRVMEFGPALNGRDDVYYEEVVWPWLADIFPARSMQYGTKTLFRFGSKGVFAQIINCYSRLEQTPDLPD